VSQLGRHVDDRHGVVDGDGVRGGAQEVVEVARVGQQAARGRLVEDRPDHLLLMPDAREVTVGELLALPRVVERRRAVHVLPPLGEVAVGRVDRGEALLDGDVDAADRVDDLLKAAKSMIATWSTRTPVKLSTVCTTSGIPPQA
jgi:hypothetical protein